MKKTIGFALAFLLVFAAFSAAGAQQLKKIAILPFAVNSSENINYIRDGIWVLSRDYMVDFLKNRYGTLIQAARQLGQPDTDTLLKAFGRVQSRLYLSAGIA